MLAKTARFWRTIRHLRPVQFHARISRRLRTPRIDPVMRAPPLRAPAGRWVTPARREASLFGPARVRYLNVEADLPVTGGWNDPARAKLWLYNLHYFDDLNAAGTEQRIDWQRSLIARWIAENPIGAGNGWEPYPLSIRIINWVKWLAGGTESGADMLDSLARQVRWLEQRIEWHLLGNHLFSNAKALTLAGLFFEGAEADRWRATGLRILARELPEQVLADGGSFERSPMYHALATEDVLDLVNMAGRYPELVPDAPLAGWRDAASRMTAWLKGMSHPDGGIALFNDAAFGIAPETAELERYARALDIRATNGAQHWPDSGYIRLERADVVALLDIAPVGPDYLPGHAHADTLSFELSVRGQRFIVNGGTSQYGNDAIRAYERSTAAHSTVEVAGRSSSEVWHGFRVGDRAKPFAIELSDCDGELEAAASHDGYCRLPGRPVHRRRWRMNDASLTVSDTLSGGEHSAVARYIVPPDVTVEVIDHMNFVLTNAIAGQVRVYIAAGDAAVEPAWYASEFGRRLATKAIAVTLAGGHADVTINWT